MSRVYLIIAALFVFAGVAASFFAPVDDMGAREAFYARLILVAPPLFIGTLLSALAFILQRLDQLIDMQGLPASSAFQEAQDEEDLIDFDSHEVEDWGGPEENRPQIPVPSSIENKDTTDFDTLFAQKLRGGQSTETHHAIPSVPQPEKNQAQFEAKPRVQDERRAPTVDEYLGQERRHDTPKVNSSPLTREGTFAGRSYRMYENGSLEIDTDQSTIRFDSLDEFRSFVSSVSKN